ncbi:recombinase family protein [Streptomyces sp. NPDC048504]|uniref:recombinase family protein n=1 Tax=Streptomyces sp. NPDC048504 TaxID=3365559 RepID=UPI00371957C1
MTESPTAYGYMRVPKDASDNEVRALEEQIESYAQRCGFDLRGIHEEHDGVLMLDLMARTVQEDNVKHVIVPSLENLSTHLAVQVVMVQMIHAAGAALHNVSAAAGDADDSRAGDQ